MSTIINTEAQLSSNIIQLNSKNWKDLEKSPHTWFVNFCRQGWGYCQMLNPEWEKLAAKTKNVVKVAAKNQLSDDLTLISIGK